jgi:hypothetical protein
MSVPSCCISLMPYELTEKMAPKMELCLQLSCHICLYLCPVKTALYGMVVAYFHWIVCFHP